jgi:hypothetical protein
VGVLAGAGVLTVFSGPSTPSWPSKRGWLISEWLLCRKLPPRPMAAPPPDGRRSIREQMINVTASGTCMGCHRYVDSPGFAFIGFDSFGRWRPEPGYGAGENRGWITREILPDEPHFADLPGLARLLADRAEARRCFAQQWLQFAVDRSEQVRTPDAGPLAASLETLYQGFQRSGFRLRALMLAIVETEAFLNP